ncbi:MAG: rod shape-determining protein [Lachnospiraceae bacterium]|nr:rod shape-determining protein [Lachnospiraceae bacterium]
MAGKKHAGQFVFGLDIGTRSIVGTVGYLEGETFHVIAQKVREHTSRSMLDGQIHDIAAVGATIGKVKEDLEEMLGRQLKEVCIAAAGRVLRTVEVHVEHTFDEDTTVTRELIYSLDLLGVEKSYEALSEKNDTDLKFYCVGYTVTRYYLNKGPMTNLENHKARNIGADIIATFLPDEVVDGLYKAVDMAGLTVANLTLEPIAAIQVAIPLNYRMLNIALVDVGAGTSDICVTRDGSVAAYGMIPTAGDRLTETIAQSLLVDFATAEKIKVAAGGKSGSISYKDIMGLSQKITPAGVHKLLKPVVEEIAKQVSDKLKELNGGKSVSAVFVVGGGGKIKGYTEALAKELGIAPERVALRGEEVMGNIQYDCAGGKKDALFVTPIGICLNFYEQTNNFIFVSFNGKRIKLYDNSHLLVVDAAMQADFPNECLFPRRGKELAYTINDKAKVQRGKPGEAAIITVNGQSADINTPISAGDKIEVMESTAGDDGSLTIGQLPEYNSTISVIVNGQKVVLPRFAQVNGELKSEFYEIQNGDDIKMLGYYTIQQIIDFMDVKLQEDMNIYVNSKRVDRDEKVYENFDVIWTMEEQKLSDYDYDAAINAEKFENLPPGEEGDVERSHITEEVRERMQGPKDEGVPIHVLVNGNDVELTGKNTYMFADVFERIDFDLKTPGGVLVAASVNGFRSEYTAPIKEGDELTVRWVDSMEELPPLPPEPEPEPEPEAETEGEPGSEVETGAVPEAESAPTAGPAAEPVPAPESVQTPVAEQA